MSTPIECNLGAFVVPADTVRLVVTVTAEGINLEMERRDAKALKRDGISMRNVRGDWIKEDTK